MESLLRNGWTLSHLKTNALNGLKKLTIKLELKLLDVFAKNNKVITNKYIFADKHGD